tara:strand:+ start:185 stop:517 length:333 start_codon:yes stop_codon:yes gene_type:complete
MKIILIALFALIFTACGSVQQTSKSPEPWTAIWNGNDFTGWHTYLGPPNEKYTDSSGNRIAPFGVDNDPLGIIRVVETDQGKAIRISGLAWGMIYTEKEYKNYHLKLKVK